MIEQNDDAPLHALMVLAGVITLVIAGALAVAIWQTRASQAAKPATPATSATTLGEPPGRIDFNPCSGALPADAESVLGPIADAARADAAKVVLISSHEDGTGVAARGEEVAGKRVESVRHALEADGVAASQLVVDKPLPPAVGADPRDACRVELRLR